MRRSNYVYAANAVAGGIIGYLLYHPLGVGLYLCGVFGEFPNEAELYLGIVVLFCALLGGTLFWTAMYFTMKKFYDVKKKRYFKYSLIPFFAVILLRLLYEYLKTWAK